MIEKKGKKQEEKVLKLKKISKRKKIEIEQQDIVNVKGDRKS